MSNYAKTNNIGEVFLALRKFRANMRKATQNYNAEIASIECYKGSVAYTEKANSLESNYKECVRNMRINGKADLQIAFAGARGSVESRLGAAPTDEMNRALDSMRKTDHLPIHYFKTWAYKMKGCPLALIQLQSIAAKNGFYINADDPIEQLNRLDLLEHTAQWYVDWYNEEDEQNFTSVSMRILDDVLVNNNPKIAETAYLESFFNIKDVADYDATYKPAPVSAYFAFNDVKELSAYINHRAEGQDGEAKQAIEDFVLANCPDSYGAALRNYRAMDENTTFSNVN